MGFLDTKAKAKAYEEDERSASMHNAQVAAEVQAAHAQKAEADRRAEVHNAYKEGAYTGLAAAARNPLGIANVPGAEMGAGYQMPAAGDVGPGSYVRPAQVAPQEQGLWKTLLNKVGY